MGNACGSNIYQVMEKRIRQYFKDKKDVVAVYLFGSYAAGTEGYQSDIDIGIVFDGKNPELMMKKRLTYTSSQRRERLFQPQPTPNWNNAVMGCETLGDDRLYNSRGCRSVNFCYAFPKTKMIIFLVQVLQI
jgi:hypothetical protein